LTSQACPDPTITPVGNIAPRSNPVHHDFLDQEGGRVIYFQGTHTPG